MASAHREAFEGFPSTAVELVRHAIRAHGGWDRWAKVEAVTFVTKTFGGPLPWMKGMRSKPGTIQVFPHAGRTVFRGFPAPELDGVFDQGDVSIVSREDGAVLTQSLAHRETFRGIRKYRRWSALDAVYFFGYAFVNYMSLPFLLENLRFVAEATWVEAGRTLRGVTVDFPAGFPTHGGRQTFYFDDEGLLCRHDYTAEVVGAWARGAHFSGGYEMVEGLPFATRRHVVATLLGRPTPIPVLHATLGDFRVTFSGA